MFYFIFNISNLMPMSEQAIHFNISLTHDVIHNEYLGDDDGTKMSHTALAI